MGQTLTGTVGTWTGATGFSQQWQRCTGASCSPISGATSLTYTPVTADVGLTLRFQVIASNTAGPSLAASSAQTAAVSAAAGSGVTDSFTRADALTLGTGWSATNWVGASSCLLAISANQAAYPAGKSGGCHQSWTGSATQTDGVGSFTVTVLPPEGGELDVGARIQNGGSSQAVLYEGAWLRHTAGPDTYYIVRRNSNGSWTSLATISGPDMVVGDQLAFKLAGSSLSLHRKPAGGSWAQILATNDTTITGPGRFGLEFYNASGAKADDWTISTDLPGTTAGTPPANTGLPTITGTAQVGQTLTGTTGSWTGTAPISYSQQWQRCNTSGTACNPISGATNLTYTPATADIGSTLRLRVNATNPAGGPTSADSTQTATVTAAAGTPPANTGLPTITGTAQVGQTLTGTTGSWTGTAPISYSQQWQRCNTSGTACNPISGATNLTYTPATADIGSTLRLRVNATNPAGGPTSADSTQTATVTAAAGTPPANTGLPTITGTAQVGQTLTGTTGSWTGTAPISYSQQWQRCNTSGTACNPISGATNLTYTPATADIGSTLRLRVNATNPAGGPTSADSTQTATVTAAAGTPPANTGLPTITGTAQVGQTLTGTTGSWTGTAPISYSQQWQRCNTSGTACNPISGATNLTYTPATADVGSTLRLRVNATNPAGGPTSRRLHPNRHRHRRRRFGVTDSFTRADALTLGTGWSATNWVGASSCLLAISANQAAYPAGKSGGCHQSWTGSATQTDGVGSFTVTVLPPEGGELDVGARIQNGGSSQAVLYEGAWLRHTAGPDTYYIVRRNSNGSWTSLATISGPDMVVGDQLAFKLAGSSLSLHRKPAGGSWAQILATNDTTITGPGRFGLEFYNASGAKADDWTLSTDLPGTTAGTPPANTGLPTITGTAQVGQTLTGTTGSWTGTAPISYSQQWQRCNTSGTACNPISGATNLTYTPATADIGSTLRLRVNATNPAGGPTSADSTQTATVTAAAGTPPANTGLPTITGTAQVGQTLTGTTGSWTGTAPISYSQQWQRCNTSGTACNPISGATNLTYTPATADIGSTLRLRVNATNPAGGPTSADSTQTATVTAAAGTPPANTGLPTITGTAQVGQTLTGTTGSWTGTAPISYSQQWQRCNTSGTACNPISGATNLTYTPATADIGSTLRLRVNATNPAGGPTSADSTQTATVTAAPTPRQRQLHPGGRSHPGDGLVGHELGRGLQLSARDQR